MMDKRQQLDEMYQRRAQLQQDSEKRSEQNKRVDDAIAQLEQDLGIEPEKLSAWERLSKIIKGVK